MASALSPTTAAVKDANPSTTKEFAELIKYYQQSHKAIVRLTAYVNRLPANQSLKIGAHTIRRSDISKYSQAYISQLSDLRKVYANRKRKSNRSNAQLNNFSMSVTNWLNFTLVPNLVRLTMKIHVAENWLAKFLF